MNICHHFDEDANDKDDNDEEKEIEREWEREREREGERALVLQSGPQGVTAKGNKCKSRLTAARAHSLAKPGQAHAGKARLTAARAHSLPEREQAHRCTRHNQSGCQWLPGLDQSGCQRLPDLTWHLVSICHGCARQWPGRAWESASFSFTYTKCTS